MPNLIERLFRAMILFAGLFWLVAGLLWAIPASYMQSILWDSQNHLRGNELYCTVMLLVIYGSCPFIGLICVYNFRKLAGWQYRQIPGLAEKSEPKWHDTAVFTTLLSTGMGLYCPELVFTSLGYLIDPITMIVDIIREPAIGPHTGLTMLDVLRYGYGQYLLTPIVYLACAAVLLTQSGKIAARVTRIINTTPPPPEDDDMPSEK